MGYKIKLLGVAQMTGRGLEQRMSPCLVPATSPLGQLAGGPTWSSLEGDQAWARSSCADAGAGEGPTAPARSGPMSFFFFFFCGHRPRHPIVSTWHPGHGARRCAFLQVAAKPRRATQPTAHRKLADKPGALAKVAPVLGETGISIDRMRQYDHPGENAPVLIVHGTRPRAPNLDTALAALPGTGVVVGAPVALRNRGRLTRRARWTGPRPSTSTANGLSPGFWAEPVNALTKRVFPAGGTGRCACRPAGGAGPARALGADRAGRDRSGWVLSCSTPSPRPGAALTDVLPIWILRPALPRHLRHAGGGIRPLSPDLRRARLALVALIAAIAGLRAALGARGADALNGSEQYAPAAPCADRLRPRFSMKRPPPARPADRGHRRAFSTLSLAFRTADLHVCETAPPPARISCGTSSNGAVIGLLLIALVRGLAAAPLAPPSLDATGPGS